MTLTFKIDCALRGAARLAKASTPKTTARRSPRDLRVGTARPRAMSRETDGFDGFMSGLVLASLTSRCASAGAAAVTSE